MTRQVLCRVETTLLAQNYIYHTENQGKKKNHQTKQTKNPTIKPTC